MLKCSEMVATLLLVIRMYSGAPSFVRPKDMSMIDRILFIQRNSIAIAYATKILFLLVEYHEMNFLNNKPRKTRDME